MNNQLLFAPEDQDLENQDNKSSNTWKIAIIDDDILVHQVTKMVLEDYTFDGMPVEFIGAFSRKEGHKLFEEHNDIAVCILDVIMETDTAGIELAHDIREQLNNHTTRIVLRTGQPGLSIEEEIISKYCINDYKTKTELTSAKLRTVITSCIRTYVELSELNKAKDGMQYSMDICGSILSDPKYTSEATEYSKAIIESIPQLLNAINDNLKSDINGIVAIIDKNSSDQILAGKSEQGSLINQSVNNILPKNIQDFIANNAEPFITKIIDNDIISCIKKDDAIKSIVFLKGIQQLDDIETDILSSYLRTMLTALNNRFLF